MLFWTAVEEQTEGYWAQPRGGAAAAAAGGCTQRGPHGFARRSVQHGLFPGNADFDVNVSHRAAVQLWGRKQPQVLSFSSQVNQQFPQRRALTLANGATLTSATAWSADSIFSNVMNAQLQKEEKHESGGGGLCLPSGEGEGADVLTGSLLAWVVHGEIDDVSMLSEGRAQAVLAQPGAINVHGVALPHSSPLRVRIRP